MEYTILLVVEVLAAIGLVGLVLLQQGKGAEMGASFGAGASQTIFGSSGSGNFMTRLTAIFATVFFLTCLGLAYLANEKQSASIDMELDFSAVEEAVEAEPGELPVVPASDASPADSASDLVPRVVDDVDETSAPSSVDDAESSPAAQASDAADETSSSEASDSTGDKVDEEEALPAD